MMIVFKKGNLLEDPAEALVNTVNTVGVMGKGIALQFKNAFSENYRRYRDACAGGKFRTGQLLVVRDVNLLYGEKLIINFPTKEDWKNPSRYEYIESGLSMLAAWLKENPVSSLAMPALGCGNGGLEWERIKKMITWQLGSLPVNIAVYEPA
jgi:O-acetyl-ADP-ribose deacetylase (regulator of RNase III)